MKPRSIDDVPILALTLHSRRYNDFQLRQVAGSAPTLRELLRRTVNLILDRFGYYDASVFMIDETGVFAVLTETGQSASALKRGRDYRVAVGANSIIGPARIGSESRTWSTGFSFASSKSTAKRRSSTNPVCSLEPNGTSTLVPVTAFKRRWEGW
jgi:hypothetical protein